MNRKVVITGGRLIDGTGSDPLENTAIVIEGTDIAVVGKAGEVAIPSQAYIIDASGKTVLPGMIDAHIHFHGVNSLNALEWSITPHPLAAIRGAKDAQALLEAGFTAVRDLGGVAGPYIKLAVEEGTITGPRIMAASRILTQTCGHADTHFLPLEWITPTKGLAKTYNAYLCDGVDECRKGARTVLREGADVIKICTTGGVVSMRDSPTQVQFSIEEVRAIVEEAHKVGKRVASHAESSGGVQTAINGGVDTIEHGYYLDEETCEMMVKNNKILTTTFTIHHQFLKYGREQGINEWALEKTKEVEKPENHPASAKRAYEAGVKIALGTDIIGAPRLKHGTNALELQFLVEKVGMSPMEALVSATRIGAEALGLDDKIGTIEAGKLADVVIVKENPLKDIRSLQDMKNILMVLKNGEIVVDREQNNK